MKVSVVILAHNEEKYIEECLKSIFSQEEKASEVIIVDNNCTDSTIKICKKFPVKIIKEATQGIIAARNRGFNLAENEIIARCDADTVVPKDWVKKIKQNFKRKELVALGGPIIYYDLPLKTAFFSNAYSYASKKFFKGNVFMGANMALKKTAWNDIKGGAGLKDSGIHEDVDLSVLAGRTGEVGFDRKMIIYTSARRIKRKPHTFFVQYPIRLARTYVRHSRGN